jgi:hypothetical protein
VTTTEVAPPPKRGRESLADMVRSLGLVAVIIAVTLIFVPALIHPSKSDEIAPIDYSDYVSGFHQLSGKVALRPMSLPKGWAANAGSLNGDKSTAHLHIGWATPGAKYAGLEEGVVSSAAFVRSVLGQRGVTVTGSVPINGVTWQTRTSTRGEYSLSHTTDGITVVITGSATDAQLQLLAASLR